MDVGDGATWAGAIATTLLFIVGGVQINSERRARKAEARDRVKKSREQQAVRVSAWVGDVGSTAEAHLLNASDEPVYQVVVWLVFIQGAAPRRGEDVATHFPGTLSVLPPGRWTTELRWPGGGMSLWPGIEVGFTDARGIHWIRRALGSVEETSETATEHYRLDGPFNWTMPEPG